MLHSRICYRWQMPVSTPGLKCALRNDRVDQHEAKSTAGLQGTSRTGWSSGQKGRERVSAAEASRSPDPGLLPGTTRDVLRRSEHGLHHPGKTALFTFQKWHCVRDKGAALSLLRTRLPATSTMVSPLDFVFMLNSLHHLETLSAMLERLSSEFTE